MTSTTFRQGRSRPRGSSVWVGLDPFGDVAIGRLTQWSTASPSGEELKAANRLLTGLRIDAPGPGAPDPGEVQSDVLIEPGEESPPPVDVAADLIIEALGDLLADQQSRAALSWSDKEVLTPHVWLVADLSSVETERLAEWTATLYERFRHVHVEARVLMVLRHRTWDQSAEQARRAEERCRLLIEHLVGESTPGLTPTVIYIVTDRDGITGAYTRSADDADSLIARSLDVLMLGDVAHTALPGTDRAFHAPGGGGPGGWETLPVFGGFAGSCLLWEAAAHERETAERRRAQLLEALAEPAPTGYEPGWPELQQVRLAEAGTWPQLDVPTWMPRFWRSARAEDERVRDLMDRWEHRADEWRHAMLVTHRDRKANLSHRAAASLAGYRQELDARERSVLDNPDLSGFFSPLHRLYDRAEADLAVRQDDQSKHQPVPDPNFDPVAKVRRPAEVMKNADSQLLRVLERKINPALLAQVTVMTIAVAWGLLVWLPLKVSQAAAARGVASLAPIPRSLPTPPSLPDHLPSLPGWLLGAFLPWLVSTVGTLIFNAFTWILDLLLSAFQRDSNGEPPSPLPLIVGTGLVTSIPLLAIAIFLALKQRVVLERAWKVMYNRALLWRDQATRALTGDLHVVESALSVSNMEAARAEVVQRRQRLADFESAARIPIRDERPDDRAVTGRIRPTRPLPPPLSPLDVSRSVAVFKQECIRMTSGLWTAPRMLGRLFAVAAEQAGDPELHLHDDAIRFRERVFRAMPPDGAVRVPPLDSTVRAEFALPPVTRFLGVPSGLSDVFMRDPDLVSLLELPVEDRFYALVIQTGMSGRRILSLPADAGGVDPSDDEAAADGARDSDSGRAESAGVA
jgi:hypothetical protein